eukprot:UN01678
MQTQAVQSMLDFDFVNGRETPSVKCLVYPFQGNHYQKFYWNNKEILIPCYQDFDYAMKKFPNITTVVNFASLRSVYDSVDEMLEKYSYTIRLIAIIAEGVPERLTRLLLLKAKSKKCYYHWSCNGWWL